MNLKIAQLRNFIDVAERRSFRAAAAQAYRSQPAISLSVKTLEEQLGGKLFQSSKPVTLTPFGEQFLALARQLIVHHDRMVLDVAKIVRGEQGSVSIAVVASVSTRWLPTIIRSFAASHPAVLVSATDDASRRVQALVESGQIDLGIGSITRVSSEVDFEALVTDYFGLVCRRDHPLGNSTEPLPWQQLTGVNIVGNSTHALLQSRSVYSYVQAPRMVMTTLTSLMANIRGGMGATILPQLGMPTNSDLVFRQLVRPRVPRTIGILTRAGRGLSPQADAFRQSVRATMSGRNTAR